MLLIGIINNAMLLIGIGSMYQDMVQGILIVLAVALDVYSKKSRWSRLRRRLPDSCGK